MLHRIKPDPSAMEVRAEFDIPKSLQQVFDDNPRLYPRFIQAVQRAVVFSIKNPQTAPAVLTQSHVKERLESCIRLAELAYNDCQWSMIHICDAMPSMLTNLIAEVDMHNIVAKGLDKIGGQPSSRWVQDKNAGDPDADKLVGASAPSIAEQIRGHLAGDPEYAGLDIETLDPSQRQEPEVKIDDDGAIIE